MAWVTSVAIALVALRRQACNSLEKRTHTVLSRQLPMYRYYAPTSS